MSHNGNLPTNGDLKMMVDLQGLFIRHLYRMDDGGIKVVFFMNADDARNDKNPMQVVTFPKSCNDDDLIALSIAADIIRKAMKEHAATQA